MPVANKNPTNAAGVELVPALAGKEVKITKLTATNDNATGTALLLKDSVGEKARYFLGPTGASPLVLHDERGIFPRGTFTAGSAITVALTPDGSQRVVADYSYFD